MVVLAGLLLTEILSRTIQFMREKSPKLFSRKTAEFCDLRIAPHFSPTDLEKIRSYLSGLISRCARPRTHLGCADLVAVQDIDADHDRIPAKRRLE